MNPSTPEAGPETGREEAGEQVSEVGSDLFMKHHYCESVDAGKHYIKCLDEGIFAIRSLVNPSVVSKATEAINFCPWCGKQLAEADDETSKNVAKLLDWSLAGMINHTKAVPRVDGTDDPEHQLVVKLADAFKSGQLQITILDPEFELGRAEYSRESGILKITIVE